MTADKVIATIYVKETGDLTIFSDVRFVESGAASALQVRHSVPGAPPELHLHAMLRPRCRRQVRPPQIACAKVS
jgi:hypothetical protein